MKVLVFSGTSEGNTISRWLKDKGIDVTVSVATEYGSRNTDADLDVHYGSYGGTKGISEEIKERGYDLVIDATHPYAVSISTHVKEACQSTGTELIRVSRPSSSSNLDGDITYVDDIDDAVSIIQGIEGRVLVTTGMKELHKYTAIDDYKDRVVARVLSVKDSILKALDLGFEGANLICARGPFSEEFNHALIEQTGASVLVTKDTGSEGGFEEKIRAAKSAGVKVIVIRRPDDDGMPVDDAIDMLCKRLGVENDVPVHDVEPCIAIIGIGMGGGTLTVDAAERIATSDLLIGAERMISSVNSVGKDTLKEYRAKEILDFIESNPKYERPAVLVSGDVGFYSAAKKLLEAIDQTRYRVEVYCGISSLVYLSSRVGMPWQDTRLLSAHGKDANIINTVRSEHSVFTLLTGSDGARRLCEELVRYGMNDVDVIIGQDLGSDKERIVSGRPSELKDGDFSELCAAIIVNTNPDRSMPIGMDDEDFIRGPAPMTKSEVRSLSIVKMKLKKDSVIYDIGAGTGSVSIEMARVADEGMVYAIEKEEPAVELIECNKLKFATPNIVTIPGMAPKAFSGLPTPTHAFIGGSSGNLDSIVRSLLELNPDIRMVINAITLETIGEITEIIHKYGFSHTEIVHLSISKARELGKYHLMTAQNPIYIVTVQR